MKTNDGSRSCPQPADVSAFIDGELDSAARARVAAHLARCPECAERLRLFGEADAASESATAAVLDPDLRARLEAIPAVMTARRNRRFVAFAAAAAVIAAAVVGTNSLPPAPIRIVRGEADRDAGRLAASSEVELTVRGAWTLVLEPGAILDVDESTGALLLVAGRARGAAPDGVPAALRTPAGDVRFDGGAGDVSVEAQPLVSDASRSTCRVLVESRGGRTEWRTPDGESLRLRGGEALFREIELRAFGPAASTAVATAAGDATRSLELYVYDGDGVPLRGASVKLLARTGDEAARVVTEAGGRADFDAVPLGDYRLRVEKPGVGEKEFPIVIDAGDTTPRSVFLGSRG